jgi:hypothetical protein
VYDDTIYNFCARARFAGCTYLRNIILALNTVQWERVSDKTVSCPVLLPPFLHLIAGGTTLRVP